MYYLISFFISTITLTFAQSTNQFSEVSISADIDESLFKEQLLTCSLAVINKTDDQNRLYEFRMAKSFGGGTVIERFIVDFNNDQLIHARAIPNHKSLDVSNQGFIPTEYAQLSRTGLPYTHFLGEWLEAMMSHRPGRYLEVNIRKAPEGITGARDILRDGYSIQASMYDWNGNYRINFSSKINIAYSEETLLPYSTEQINNQQDLEVETILPFSFSRNLKMPEETYQVEVICD